jgi:hypothetical protein
MPTGRIIIDNFKGKIEAKHPSSIDHIQVLATTAQMEIFDLQTRVNACHCECMGMYCENIHSDKAQYNMKDFDFVMQKWGVIDDRCNPLI